MAPVLSTRFDPRDPRSQVNRAEMLAALGEINELLAQVVRGGGSEDPVKAQATVDGELVCAGELMFSLVD